MRLIFSRLILVLFIWPLTSCNFSPSSNFHFTGEGDIFLVESNELPPQWNMENSWVAPLRGGDEWRRTFVTPNNPFKRLVSSAAVFEDEKEAAKYWDETYEWRGVSQSPSCVDQTKKYNSILADQFEIFCMEADSSPGISPYEYFILARYGNVVATFSAVAVDEPSIDLVQASEVGVLRSQEMEALLKSIDEKFQQASLSSQ